MTNSVGQKRRSSAVSESASTVSNARRKTDNLWDNIALSHLHIKTLYQYIKSNGDVDAVNNEGYGLLYLAAHNKNLEALCMLLLQRGTNVNKTHGPHAELALHAACAKGHLDAVELLIENGSLVDVKDALGHTPLTNAILSGSGECIAFILQQNADASVIDSQGNSLLHLTASSNVVQAVPLLVSKQVPVDGHNQRGLSPLAVAISFGHSETALALIDAGANVDGKTRLATVLHYAVTWNRFEVVKKLVESHCQVNVLNAIEETPLYVAVQQRKIDLVRYLVEQAKADPCFPKNANLPLLYAASHGYTEICKLVLSSNTSSYFIETAASMSARAGHQQTEKFLREKCQESVTTTTVHENDDAAFRSLIHTFSDEESN
ncbi:hypothetical protein G6F43_009986 [Rhizopus delemar]|nr:hypothetical protein G6F43_009986 [Rhizopus delemar]